VAEGPPYVDRFAVQISERKFLDLRLRVLPGAGNRAIGSIIINQAPSQYLIVFVMR
jgi:hypothetical protein